MKLEVPFYKQTTPYNCGPMALKMVLAYFGKDEEIDVLEEKMEAKQGKGISTIQIAIAAKSLGYEVDFYSKYISFNEENLKQEFYKKYAEEDLVEQSKKWIDNAKELGVSVLEKTLSLGELLKLATKNSIPIVLIDWNIIKNKEGYHGHFVPIVGYDEENIYMHNHGLKSTQEFMPVPRNIFDEARKSNGTDEDIVVIHGN